MSSPSPTNKSKELSLSSFVQSAIQGKVPKPASSNEDGRDSSLKHMPRKSNVLKKMRLGKFNTT